MISLTLTSSLHAGAAPAMLNISYVSLMTLPVLQSFTIYSKIACAPLGTQAATLNIESAFCTIPVLPEHKNFTVVECDGFWIDHVCPFGCLSSGGNQGEIADAIVDILEHKGIGPIKKWVDNFDVFRYPSTTGSFRDVNDTSPLGQSFRYDYDLSSLKDAVASLGIPWHKTKVQEFGNAFRYVGFDWLILEKSVSLPDEKRLRYLALVTTFVYRFEHSQAPLSNALKINGVLAHISFVYPSGRSFLSNLSNWIAHFPHRLARRYVPASVISDLKWWSMQLAIPGWHCSLEPRKPVLDFGLWVDASTLWGIGLIHEPLWDAWHLRSGWRGPCRDIGWLEAVAVELAVLSLQAGGFHDQHILVRSDNQGVIGAWEKGRGRNFEVNLCIRRTNVIAAACGIDLSFLYVPSAINLADPISRGELGSASHQVSYTFELPEALARFIEHV